MTIIVEDLQPTLPFEELRKQKLQFYLFGLHISKSRAPLLLNTIFKSLGLDWNYALMPTDCKKQFQEKSADSIGAAITMPNKIEFLSEVDVLDPVGHAVNSINSVYTRKTADGRVVRVGTNTDTVGIQESFLQTPAALPYVALSRGRPGLVYGGGGASRSAVYALHRLLGCSVVYVVNRDAAEVDLLVAALAKSAPEISVVPVQTVDQARALDPPQLAVLCVPNFAPVTPDEIRARLVLGVFMDAGPGAVLEMCYHPNPYTMLYNDFKAAGWVVIGGVHAVIYQGVAQAMLWTGYTWDELPVKQAAQAVIADLESHE